VPGRVAALRIEGASENNLRDVTVDLPVGMTAIVGVSGSGKSSLAFDTLYSEARRRYVETLSLGSPWLRTRPARVRSIRGLGPAVAVAQNVLNRNPLSTVATAAGIHPYLRVLFARYAERRCVDCGTETVTTTLDQQLAILRHVASSAAGPVEVIAPLLRRAEGSHQRLLGWLTENEKGDAITVDGAPWAGGPLNPDRPHDIALRVATVTASTDGRALRMSLEMVEALGSVGVILRIGSGSRSLARAPICPGCGRPFEVLEPEDFRIGGLAADAYRLGGLRLKDFLALDVAAAQSVFGRFDLPGQVRTLVAQVTRRLDALVAVGLEYLALDRASPTLSRGEAQRLRIALLLANPIEDLLHVLDEPTIGLDPDQMRGVLGHLARLRGPVVMVEHDRWAVAAADHVVELGPGAGDDGGRVTFEGSPAVLWRSATISGRWFSGRERQVGPARRPEATESLQLNAASLHNLDGFDAAFPVGRLTVVAGPSGAGKTTLVRDVLVASLAAHEPRGCDRLSGPPLRPITVSQEPIGRNARSNAATYSGLADHIRALFADGTGASSTSYSFNRPEGACPACEGIGSVELKLPYVPSEWLTCESCEGRRFKAEVLAKTIRMADGVARSVADVYELAVDEAARLLTAGAAGRILASLQTVGLGYLRLGQPSPTLSGGEAQRVKLAKWLAVARPGDLIVLDEPTTGLHPADVDRLVTALHALVDRGSTVVVVEHQPDIIAAADWLIRLGPGGGPAGGRLLYRGPPAQDERRLPVARPRAAPRRRPRASPDIRIRGASANNLRNVSVTIAKGAITGVVGVSGSGKSSLIRDVLEAEAVRRFLESLSMYERQSVREGPEAPVSRIEGLGPTIAIGTDRRTADALSTVGVATELSFHLGVLLAFAGRGVCGRCRGLLRRRGGPAGRPWRCDTCAADGPVAEPAHFSPSTYSAACLTCHGVGTVAQPRLERLVVRPEAPICGGALYSPGYFPASYLSKPESLGYWMLQGLAQHYSFDPFVTPWREMSEEARQAFLFADEDVEIPPRPGKEGPRTLRWRGVLRIVSGWDLGGLYVDHEICPGCGGGRLRPEFLEVRLGGLNRHDLHLGPIGTIERLLADLVVPPDVPHWVEQSRLVGLRRLGFLRRVGLGHLNLDRLSRTLSAGESQRVKLASLLGSELSGLTVLLDEPSRGLHPREVDILADALVELRDIGNAIVLVDHDPRLLDRVDRLVVLGPGPGARGGRLMAAGSAATVRRPTRNADLTAILAAPSPRRVAGPRRSRRETLVIRQPTEHNLAGEDVAIPLRVLAGLCGVSGSGKSTLAIDILARALAPARLTTSVAYEDIQPGAHAGIKGAPGRVVHSDQSRAGIQTPGAFLGVVDPLRRAFADSAEAAARELTIDDLRPNCDQCHGRGRVREDMGFLPSIERPCDGCGGTGYRPEIRDLIVRRQSLADLSRAPFDEVLAVWGDVEPVAGPLRVAASLGLGYLALGQPSRSLSGGEAQRLRLTRELARPARHPTLYILDEPTVGLHASDVGRLIDVLDGLVDGGHSVLVVEHDPVVLACCDWLVELGPGGGPDGGHVVAAGSPEQVATLDTPTAPYLRAALA
jgi:excinuclease ABC subunit A